MTASAQLTREVLGAGWRELPSLGWTVRVWERKLPGPGATADPENSLVWGIPLPLRVRSPKRYFISQFRGQSPQILSVAY